MLTRSAFRVCSLPRKRFLFYPGSKETVGCHQSVHHDGFCRTFCHILHVRLLKSPWEWLLLYGCWVTCGRKEKRSATKSPIFNIKKYFFIHNKEIVCCSKQNGTAVLHRAWPRVALLLLTCAGLFSIFTSYWLQLWKKKPKGLKRSAE